MALFNKKVTDAEKAALYLHVFGGFNDWTRLYCMADGIKDEKQINTINKSIVYRWKNSAKVVGLLDEITRQKNDMIKGGEEDRTGEEDGKGRDNIGQKNVPKHGTSKYVDYSLPENQSRKLNQLINESGDNGEVLDALKVIISTQKADRDAAKAGKVVNAYVPMICAECPLYKRAKKA